MRDDLIKWYKNFIEFSAQEKKVLNAVKPEVIIEKSDADYLLIQNAFFDRMPFCNINTVNRYITFDKSGTDFINKIFETEINDETLVISSIHEHESVKKWLKIIKNVILLDLNDDYTQSIDKILFEAKKYKKVFVYIIGTQISTGEITPQEFFIQLKQKFEKNNINYKIMLDDVQGMFLVPRDYSIFDYILYTAHAMVYNYNAGLLISKDGKFGTKAYNLAEDYLKKLDIILAHKDKIFLFKQLFIQYFSFMIRDTNTFKLYNYTADHIFAIETTGIYYTVDEIKKLEDYKIWVSEQQSLKNCIRLRYREFAYLSEEKILKGLAFLTQLISKKLIIKKMKE